MPIRERTDSRNKIRKVTQKKGDRKKHQTELMNGKTQREEKGRDGGRRH